MVCKQFRTIKNNKKIELVFIRIAVKQIIFEPKL